MSVKKIVLDDGSVKWEARTYTKGRTGRRLSKRFETKVEAQQFLHNFFQRKKELTKLPGEGIRELAEIKFAEVAEFFLEHKGEMMSHGYRRALVPGMKAIRPWFAHLPLSEVTTFALLEFRKTLKSRGLSVATQNRYCQLVQRMVNFFYEQGKIGVNPIRGFRPMKEPPVELTFWEESELLTFLNFADRKYPLQSKNRWVFVAYLLALETGLRANEIWGLQVKDLRFSNHLINVLRQVAKNGIYTQTKGRNHRVVPMSEVLKTELKLLVGGVANAESPVFQNEVGRPIDHNNFADRIFLKDLEESGMRRLRFHDLRHTALTQLVRKNTSPWLVQKIAGHQDLRTTMRYVHIAGRDIEELAQNRVLYNSSGGRVLELKKRP